MRTCALSFPLILLAACGPLPPGEAEDRCEERARLAAKPQGQATVGYSSTAGTFSGVELTISSDYIAGRDPQEVYETCVFEYTGEGPIRPLRL